MVAKLNFTTVGFKPSTKNTITQLQYLMTQLEYVSERTHVLISCNILQVSTAIPWTTPPGVAWPGICICSRAQPSPGRYKQNQREIFLLYRIQNYINHTYVVGPRNCTKKQIQVLCSTTMKRNGSRAMTKDPFGWLLGCLNQVAARDVWSRYIGHAEAFSGCSGCTTTIVHKFP